MSGERGPLLGRRSTLPFYTGVIFINDASCEGRVTVLSVWCVAKCPPPPFVRRFCKDDGGEGGGIIVTKLMSCVFKMKKVQSPRKGGERGQVPGR